MWNKKTKKQTKILSLTSDYYIEKKKLGVKHLVSFTEWKCTYKIHKLLISTYKCVYETQSADFTLFITKHNLAAH